MFKQNTCALYMYNRHNNYNYIHVQVYKLFNAQSIYMYSIHMYVKQTFMYIVHEPDVYVIV